MEKSKCLREQKKAIATAQTYFAVQTRKQEITRPEYENLKMAKVLMYLFLISNEDKIVLKTQEEIANALNLSSTNINRIFYKLRELKILEKKANGRYFLII